MDAGLSLAEKRLLLALADGQAHAADDAAARAGFASEGEVLQAAGGPERRGLVAIETVESTSYALSAEGRVVLAKGLPERRAFSVLRLQPSDLADLIRRANLSMEEARIIVGLLKRHGVVRTDKTATGMHLVALAESAPTIAALEDALNAVAAGTVASELVETQAFQTLLERRLIVRSVSQSRKLRLTPAGIATARTASSESVAGLTEVNQLTPELIARWSGMSREERARQALRPFDFDVPVTVPSPGKAHPLTHIIQEIREIFVALGFSEIAGDYVEPAFWNMDALFIPQDHPARDMQDTFYLKAPAAAAIPDGLFGTVRGVHQTGGGTGSTGWGGGFERATAERTLLRTHTTVTTVRHLAAHPKPPVRVFGIGRVFRNEAMDATHLPEFHQVEGIVAEDGATLSMLMGVLREFYKRMGFPQVKFRPSFYPYTEPSLDVAVKWGSRWLELGGAGVFRPEVTKPLGVPCNVLAWGLGLERLAMLRLGLKDIRQLYLSDVDWLRTTPVR